MPDEDITTSADGLSRTVTSDAVFLCSEVISMPISLNIYYDSEMTGTSVSFETQINVRKESEKKAEEIVDQLSAYNLSIDDNPEEETETTLIESITENEEEATTDGLGQ